MACGVSQSLCNSLCCQFFKGIFYHERHQKVNLPKNETLFWSMNASLKSSNVSSLLFRIFMRQNMTKSPFQRGNGAFFWETTKKVLIQVSIQTRVEKISLQTNIVLHCSYFSSDLCCVAKSSRQHSLKELMSFLGANASF